MANGFAASVFRHWKTFLKAAAVLALIAVCNIAVHALADALNFQIRPSNEDRVHAAIMLSAVLYAVLLAVPFVPGAEIGLALIAALGPPIALLVYVCTLAGLTLSYLVGRILPVSGIIRLAEAASLHRTSRLLAEIAPLDRAGRLEYLTRAAPGRWAPTLLSYRYIALAIAFNVPGNFLIGGGGGIALLAGVSRLYSVPGYLATIAIAVSPVPLAVILFGSEFLGR